MVAVPAEPLAFELNKPLSLNDRDFHRNKYEWYRWLLEPARGAGLTAGR